MGHRRGRMGHRGEGNGAPTGGEWSTEGGEWSTEGRGMGNQGPRGGEWSTEGRGMGHRGKEWGGMSTPLPTRKAVECHKLLQWATFWCILSLKRLHSVTTNVQFDDSAKIGISRISRRMAEICLENGRISPKWAHTGEISLPTALSSSPSIQ